MVETEQERWQRKGLDPKYGPRWYLYKDGRPPLDDDRDYAWNPASRCWETIWADDGNDEI